LNKFPGKEPFALQSSAGTVFLTNRRIVYLPTNPSTALESFAAPILNLHDTHVTAPFFGPNVWTAVVQPVPGGNIPPQCSAVELKMTFKEGGAFDFHSTYERIKDRLQQAVEIARESGRLTGDGEDTSQGHGAGVLAGVNMDAVHLDELPTYDVANASGNAVSLLDSPVPHFNAAPMQSPGMTLTQRTIQGGDSPPSEPPRYEDVQRGSVSDELERRLREN